PEAEVEGRQEDRPLARIEDLILRVGRRRLARGMDGIPERKVPARDDVTNDPLARIVIGRDVPVEQRATQEEDVEEEDRERDDDDRHGDEVAAAVPVAGYHYINSFMIFSSASRGGRVRSMGSEESGSSTRFRCVMKLGFAG